MTDEEYESCRWGHCQADDSVDDHAIKNKIAIKGAIVIGDQVCDHDQVGADHDKRSR